MNISNTMGLSPSSFRRVLTEHGRSSLPGLLEAPSTPKLISQKRKLENTPEQPQIDGPPTANGVTESMSKAATSASLTYKLPTTYAAERGA